MDKIRQEFESWFEKKIASLPMKMSLTRYDGGLYVSDFTQLAWMAWCDSRYVMSVDLPRVWSEEQETYRDELIDSLDEVGVSYK